MSEPKFSFELTPSGLAKQRAMRNIMQANKRQMQSWLTMTHRLAKRSASQMQKSDRHTSQMQNNIADDIIDTNDGFYGIVGTGVKGTQTVKYARKQDVGGKIVAKGKYLTIPFPGVKGTARSQPGKTFFFKSRAGNLILARTQGKGKLVPLFLLKKSVTIPASRWFTKVIDARRNLLTEMLKPANVLRVAEKMGGK